ncbi:MULTISPECIES: hypothetical protein [unclassified Streptomyces]|uniref:hypothetical protein n=1 Tax=unclassified Streptomyces TaxID=2593676 RepID=UPI003823A04B|nr:hypothetical protein OG199_39645 [Streptomyces sp. NBC_01176]
MLRVQLQPLSTAVGQVVVCEVDGPGSAPHTHVYVAVVTRPEPHYGGSPLAMILTIHHPNEAPGWLREDPPPGVTWLRDPPDPTVANVYARPSFRVPGVPQDRPAVQVGRQLVGEGLLGRHSTSRSVRGSQWAEAVGGRVPPVEDEAVAAGFDSWAERELDRLERQSWWHDL